MPRVRIETHVSCFAPTWCLGLVKAEQEAGNDRNTSRNCARGMKCGVASPHPVVFGSMQGFNADGPGDMWLCKRVEWGDD
jgi:hypothetical protein